MSVCLPALNNAAESSASAYIHGDVRMRGRVIDKSERFLRQGSMCNF